MTPTIIMMEPAKPVMSAPATSALNPRLWIHAITEGLANHAKNPRA